MTFHWNKNRHLVTASAEVVVPIVLDIVGEVKSCIDIGSGDGAWIEVLARFGVDNLLGVDNGIKGDYLELDCGAEIHSRDITNYDAKRKYDLCLCLEVAEHLRPQNATRLVELLTQLSDTVLFCAATPGQGGDGHINEQPHEYWHEIFWEEGFYYNGLAPILPTQGVLPWYRDNMMVYWRGEDE